MRTFALAFAALATLTGCSGARGDSWVNDLPESKLQKPVGPGAWQGTSTFPERAEARIEDRSPRSRPVGVEVDLDDDAPQGGSISVRDLGDGVPRAVIAHDDSDLLFRNTYYDFPAEGGGAKDATVFDASCAPIAKVTSDFHDRVCVQGSGRLASGVTVSFAKRGCACAATCPRTGQQICYERLDPARFPHGRGALGKPITPLRTVAVDSKVIPLGTPIFVPEYVGLPRPDGTKHDGCFLAEDRGLKVTGRQIDVFTGDPALTREWNALVPSNRGVHVAMNDPRCRSGG
ncbi:MAG: 3D domain-containing protein [Byssovorax sp.]